MPRRRILCVYLCILAAWVQFVTPVAALSMGSSSNGFGVVCARAADDSAGRGDRPVPHHHHDGCCLICHADLGVAPLGERPAFTAFDYPVASPLRWRLVRAGPPTSIPRRVGLPRGPPSLV